MNPRHLTRSLVPGLALALALCAGASAAENEPFVIDVHEFLSFETQSDAVVVTATGFEIDGYVTVRTPFQDYALPGASLTFTKTETDGPLDFELVGTASPSLVALPGAGQYFGGSPMASVGVATRDTLKAMLEEPTAIVL